MRAWIPWKGPWLYTVSHNDGTGKAVTIFLCVVALSIGLSVPYCYLRHSIEPIKTSLQNRSGRSEKLAEDVTAKLNSQLEQLQGDVRDDIRETRQYRGCFAFGSSKLVAGSCRRIGRSMPPCLKF